MLNFVQNEEIIPLQEVMCSYNETQVSPYDPTKLAIPSILRPEDDLISNCDQSLKKTVFSSMTLCTSLMSRTS